MLFIYYLSLGEGANFKSLHLDFTSHAKEQWVLPTSKYRHSNDKFGDQTNDLSKTIDPMDPL